MERVRLCAGARAIGTAYERPRVRADWTRGAAGPDFYADSHGGLTWNRHCIVDVTPTPGPKPYLRLK